MSEEKKPANLPEKESRGKSQHHKIEAVYSGPLPTSSEYDRYEYTLPGSADRILTMAEKQQEHTMTIEKRGQLFFYGSKIFAQLIILVVALCSLFTGAYLIINDHDVKGISLILVALGGLTGSIIYGKKKGND